MAASEGVTDCCKSGQ